MAEQYKLVAESPQSTVVSEYETKGGKAVHYQSEAEMERELIKQLGTQAYEYLPLTSEKELVENLRCQLERLNDYHFSNSEWKRFFAEVIANPKLGIVDKTALIQDDHIQLLHRDDGSKKNIYLIDKNNIHNNSLQVINQYVPEGGSHENRYDVTILVNGFPLVHVELKRRGVALQEAFNQIRRYNRESFWAGSGLFEFVQIFVISNGTNTKYYSNTTREAHIRELGKTAKNSSKKQTSNSFEFTSYWATRENKVIAELVDFTATFFSRHTLLNILTKYCVLTSEKLLLVMRPYQICATESILQKIRLASNYKRYGTLEGGGYVWHTTGSGKTLTSFKTARLASSMPEIDKVMFVVDRKDLDYQTMKEYDRFEKGAANSNTNTSILKRQLEDEQARIIITTIQKLSIFIAGNKQHSVYDKRVVFIFDECHRSQFGDMHKAIVRKFKKYHLFGFTGTPIFPTNASMSGKSHIRTTEQAFGERLHIYTIVDAIADGNVLPFRVDYISTMREKENIRDEQVSNIDRERALAAPERISRIVQYILEHFEQKTKRASRAYAFSQLTNVSEVASARNRSQHVQEKKGNIHLRGFNSIFAVSSIDAAKLYYLEMRKQMESLPPDKRLNIATIYSYGANEDVDDGTGLLDDENSENTDRLDGSSRDFLESAIADYNATFGTQYDTSADRFQNYYKDVSLRMKNREIDLLIVVNMFLTGFDATTLNTLWVDKNLKLHGLLQAYSRTNRILNSIKTFGNIVCFRDLEDATNESIALFGDKEAGGLVLLKTFDDYYNGYTNEKGREVEGYRELIERLLRDYPLEHFPLRGEERERTFIKLYGAILKLVNILSTFDQFAGKEILTERQEQEYRSQYLDFHDKYRKQGKGESVDVNDDIVFEMELIKQVEINIDYILYLIEQMHDKHVGNKDIQVAIQKAVNASPTLREKKDLLEAFINELTPESSVQDSWHQFVLRQQQEQLDAIIRQEHLKEAKTYEFVSKTFADGFLQESGTGIMSILPPMPLFSKGGERATKKQRVLELLRTYFRKFYDISDCLFTRESAPYPFEEEDVLVAAEGVEDA